MFKSEHTNSYQSSPLKNESTKTNYFWVWYRNTHKSMLINTSLCTQLINIIWAYTLPDLALFYLFNQQTGLGKLWSVGPISTTAYFCMAPTICMFFLKKHLLRSSSYFLIGLLVFWYCAAWAICIFWILIPCWLLHLQIFSPILMIFFLFCLCFSLQCKSQLFATLWTISCQAPLSMGFPRQ